MKLYTDRGQKEKNPYKHKPMKGSVGRLNCKLEHVNLLHIFIIKATFMKVIQTLNWDFQTVNPEILLVE